MQSYTYDFHTHMEKELRARESGDVTLDEEELAQDQ